MAIKPILFNTEMVLSTLSGKKTSTRKLVEPRQFMGMLPDKCKNAVPDEFLKGKRMMFKPYCDMTDAELIMTAYKEPYQPGDTLYVRETWMNYAGRTMYRADCDKYRLESLKLAEFSWKPSIHMPKEAARIWLKVTDVRVERLQDITEDGAWQEGTDCWDDACYADNGWHPTFEDPDSGGNCDIISGFRKLWNSTIKKSYLDRYGWDANPWVWVISFERCEKPEGAHS